MWEMGSVGNTGRNKDTGDNKDVQEMAMKM